MILNEILDTRFKNVHWDRKSGEGTEFKFTVPGNAAYNPNDVDIEYTVNIQKPHKRRVVPAKADAIPGEPKPFLVKLSSVTFRNHLTGYRTLGSGGYRDINAQLLFSTIAKIIVYYIESVSGTSQGITFVPAHERLRKAYNILAKVAEKRSELVWINPDRPSNYILIRKDIFEAYKRKIGV